jgi:hypothetical protein
MSYIDRIPTDPQRPPRPGDIYTAMCHYRRHFVVAFAGWLADNLPASDIDLETDASISVLRQLAALPNGGGR